MSAGFPSIRAAHCAVPPHTATQQQSTQALARMLSLDARGLARLQQLHTSSRVQKRHLAIPLSRYFELGAFGEVNRIWTETALELGEQSLRAAFDKAGIEPRELDHLFFVTITGLATPSIDARLVNRLGLRSDVKRTPIFGLGCVAGAAGVARVSDYLRAFPEQTAALLSIELCSLTIQRSDPSVANLVASGLFGDGAAAGVRGGATQAGGPKVIGTRSVFYPDTEWVMGWDFLETGFKVVLSGKVPELVRAHVRQDVDAFLGEHGLTRKDIRHWVCHTGGPKVIEAFEDSLELPPNALERSWRSLEQYGNLSSASVLFVLEDTLRTADAQEGDFGLLMAMGPGFCSELVLLRW